MATPKAKLHPRLSPLLAPGDPVWVYLRHSPGDEQDIVSQRRAVADHCSGSGLAVREWFTDEAESGGSVEGRDAFSEMIRASHLCPPPVKAIVVWRLNRFARNDLESQFYMADLRLRGIDVVSMKDEIPQGEFAGVVEAFIRWKDQRYLIDLQADVMRGLDATVLSEVTVNGMARRGFSGGGRPPVGYEPCTVQIGTKPSGRPKMVTYWEKCKDGDLRARVALAWKMAVAGAARGEKPPVSEIHRSCRLHKNISSYYTMLGNITYAGFRRVGERRVEGAHDPYVSKEDYEMVLLHLPKGKLSPTVAHPKRVNSAFLLSGRVFCGYCGGRIDLERDNRSAKYATLRCSTRKRDAAACHLMKLSHGTFMEGIAGMLRAEVFTVARFRRGMDELNARLSASKSGVAERRRRLMREISALDRSITGLLDLVEKTPESAALKERLLQRERERSERAASLAAIAAEEKLSGPVKVSDAALAVVVAELLRVLEEGDEEELRAMLCGFITRVEITNEEGRVAYTLPSDRLLPPSNGGYGWRARGEPIHSHPLRVSGEVRIPLVRPGPGRWRNTR